MALDTAESIANPMAAAVVRESAVSVSRAIQAMACN